jgi:ADP-heptose:LPS heptosyltransferase
MNLELQRTLDRFLGALICWILSVFSSRSRHDSLKPKNILVILLSEMGSLFLARPMFDHIRGKYPEASLFVMVFERNKEVLEILNVVPLSHILTIRDDSMTAFLRDSMTTMVELRQRKIDTVIDCELFSRISSIYSFLSGARIRVGFHPHTQEGLFRGNFINRPVLYNPYYHMAEQFITLAEAIESDRVPTVKRRIDPNGFELGRMELSPDEIARLRKRIETDFPAIRGKRLVLIYPGGGLIPIRAWPLGHFCSVAADLLRNHYAVAVIGLESDGEMGRHILSYCQSPNCIDLCGYTKTVRELLALFHSACVLITNDGGPGHFAAITPLPTVILYGPETPVLYGPLDKKAVNLYAHCSCSPCLTAYNHRNSPCDGDNQCLKMIQPEEVLRHAYEILGKAQAQAIESPP